MYRYESLIKGLLGGRHYIISGENLRCSCPFHEEDTHPSFSISLEKGCFKCFACDVKGSITDFVAQMTGMSNSEAWREINSYLGNENSGIECQNNKYQNNKPYSLEDYSREKRIDLDKLKVWGLEDTENGKSIKIPYFDTEGNFVACRHRNNPDSETRFWWEGGSLNLYGLNYLNNFSNDYIVLVERGVGLPRNVEL